MQKDHQDHLQPVPFFIAGVMLLVALANMEYGYYQFLRLMIFAVSAYVIYATRSSMKIDFWMAISSAILFNPIAPIILSKDSWHLIDSLFATYFISGGIAIYVPKMSRLVWFLLVGCLIFLVLSILANTVGFYVDAGNG